MAKRARPPTASDGQVRALLERDECPVPFHAVRTRLLGNIASPDMQGSPIRMVEALWGGELRRQMLASLPTRRPVLHRLGRADGDGRP